MYAYNLILKFAANLFILLACAKRRRYPGNPNQLQVCRTVMDYITFRIHGVHRVCPRSEDVCRKVITNILNPNADRDIIRVSEVFVLRHIQIPHSRRAKNRPRVKCRRVSINIGAIYNTVYDILSRRVCYYAWYLCFDALQSNQVIQGNCYMQQLLVSLSKLLAMAHLIWRILCGA